MATKTQLLALAPALGRASAALINDFAPAVMAVLQKQIRSGAFAQDGRPGTGALESEARVVPGESVIYHAATAGTHPVSSFNNGQ